MVEVRPFARKDRGQLSRLVNAHVAAATPGGSVPVAMLLNDLERPLGEDIIGPWVTDVVTLVALHHDRLVGAAHLRRYTDDDRASESYRDAGEIVWLLCWPDHLDAGRAVRDRSIARLGDWGVRIHYGDGSLPVPGVYGVSDSWPHVRTLYEEAGFDPNAGQVEIIFAGKVEQFLAPGDPPIEGLTVRRQLGPLGTAFNALLNGEVVGTYEVDDDLTRGGANLAFAGWADECNHWVRDDLRGRGIGTWLVANAGAWLRLGGTTRLMAYAIDDGAHTQAWIRYYSRYGLTPINRTTRGWQKKP
jgi:GNAT superfamily N-acetyltransferase